MIDALEIEKKSLREHPTVPGWMTEIGRIVSGQRAAEIRRHITADQYVAQMISMSPDPVPVRTEFLVALRRMVEQWHPSVGNVHELIPMLDLLKAHTPSCGFSKVLSLVLSGAAVTMPAISNGLQTPVDVQMKALVVLYYYYPSPPHDMADAPGYPLYVQALETHAINDLFRKYSGYAVGRLLELEVIQPNSFIVKEALTRNPHVLEAVFKVVLHPKRWRHLPGQQKKRMIDDDLSTLCALCFELCGGNVEEFDALFRPALESSGAMLQYSSAGLDVELRDETQLRLTYLPSDTIHAIVRVISSDRIFNMDLDLERQIMALDPSELVLGVLD